jgi:hypothetical protein
MGRRVSRRGNAPRRLGRRGDPLHLALGFSAAACFAILGITFAIRGDLLPEKLFFVWAIIVFLGTVFRA